MRKKTLKVLAIFLITITSLILILTICDKCFAVTDVTKNPEEWEPLKHESTSDLKLKVKPILTTIRNIGIIISVLTLAVIALKIMFGSIEEKAKYKETLIPWLVGAFMVFSMTTIPNMIFEITHSSINGETTTIRATTLSRLFGPGQQKEIKCISGHEGGYHMNEIASGFYFECSNNECDKSKIVNIKTVSIKCPNTKCNANLYFENYKGKGIYECWLCENTIDVSFKLINIEESLNGNTTFNGISKLEIIGKCLNGKEMKIEFKGNKLMAKCQKTECGCSNKINKNSIKYKKNQSKNEYTPLHIDIDETNPDAVKLGTWIKRIVLEVGEYNMLYVGESPFMYTGSRVQIEQHGHANDLEILGNTFYELYYCTKCCAVFQCQY